MFELRRGPLPSFGLLFFTVPWDLPHAFLISSPR
jgi:hypothetical protein